MNAQKSPRQLPAVEPFWPWGSVAYVSIKPDGTLHLRSYPVQSVTKIENGWHVVATAYADDDDDLLFEVDEWGESAMCWPWDRETEDFYVEGKRKEESRLIAGAVIDEAVQPRRPVEDEEDKGDWTVITNVDGKIQVSVHKEIPGFNQNSEYWANHRPEHGEKDR